MLRQNQFRGQNVFLHCQYLKLHSDNVKLEGFFKKNAQGFIENSMPVRFGEYLLWSWMVQRNDCGAVKYKYPVSGKWKYATGQRLSYMVSRKYPNVGGRDVSQLCVCADHLLAGQGEINCEHVECVNCGICSGHGTYPS